MLRYIKEYRFYILLFFFVLIPITSIDLSMRQPRELRFYDRAILALSTPIQSGITALLESIMGFAHQYLFVLNTQRDNAQLLDENRKLLNTILSLREAESENLRLRDLLSFKEEYELKTVTARVIAKDVSTEFRAIRINRGSNVGITTNMAVVSAEGVVGRVLRTTEDSADVITILDLLSAIDVLSKRSRVRGIVEGKTDELCQLKFALRTDDLQEGDLLISSGLGGIFPKGLSVGSVSRVVRRKYGITQTVEVRPSVDFSKLEEVLVVTGANASPLHVTKEGRSPIPLSKSKP